MINCISVFYFPDAVQDQTLHCNKYHLLGRRNPKKTPRTNKTKKCSSKGQIAVGKTKFSQP